VQISEADRIPGMLNEVVNKARALGTNPLRYTAV
jgi:hypothetical protein